MIYRNKIEAKLYYTVTYKLLITYISLINMTSISHDYRYYQQEADDAICDELLTNNECLVKMFCGTGKSLLMRKCGIITDKRLVVYVFPSLPLIDQFYSDYLSDFPSEDILKISSELEATTDPVKINRFLSKQTNKIICVTYHSYGTLLENLGGVKINVSIVCTSTPVM